ncbi:unnamed protein product [Nippostrongylus brasiliensis]|uniref:NTR domain-containing protein n=1 Tax=Nippostrongylus brasiliensis TaxID=27835 RepID=A0A0N4YI61_NIPBR|nr:unnamed protein product [Nippostrongylus brasiliensis]
MRGLRLNVKKTKFISSEEGPAPIVDCDGETIEMVDDFRYLGSDLSRDGGLDQAVIGRISAAWMKWRESTGILCDRRVLASNQGSRKTGTRDRNEDAPIGMWMDAAGQGKKRGRQIGHGNCPSAAEDEGAET